MTNRYSDTKWDYNFQGRPTPQDYIEKGFKITKIVDPKIVKKEAAGKLIPHITKTRHKGKNFVKTNTLTRLGLINEKRDMKVTETFLRAGIIKIIKEADKPTRDLVKSFIKSSILLDEEIIKLGKLLKISDFAAPDADDKQIMEEYGVTLEQFNKERLNNVKVILDDYRKRQIIFI